MTTEQNNKSIKKPQEGEDFIRIQDLYYLCLSHWRWFIISMFCTIGLATIYLLKTPSVYTRSASLLVKDDRKGQSMANDISSSFSDMGLFQNSTNVNNELNTLKSPALALEVVKRLQLNKSYWIDGRFHKEILYGKNLPVNVTLANISENESASLKVTLLGNNKIQLSDFIYNDEAFSDPVNGLMGQAIKTPIGTVVVSPSDRFSQKESMPESVYLTQSSLYDATESCMKNLTVTLNDEKATILDLSYNDVSIQRAEDVLNTLMDTYNEAWVKDKNQIAISTSSFISERLNVIEQELGHVDADISSYKSEHLVPDVQAASTLYMNKADQADKEILDLNNRMYMARHIRDYMNNESNNTHLLPANSGLDSPSIEAQINDYNSKMIERNSLAANSSNQNPIVKDLDQVLNSLRKAINSSIDNQIVTLSSQIKTMQHSEGVANSQIAANPKQAKYLLSVERQQKVKEALYLFLLQKREENELSQAFTAYNTRIITPPMGKNKPTAPVNRNILLVACVLGFLIPIVMLFIRENMNTVIRGKKDIESLSLPFIGEVPMAQAPKRRTIAEKLHLRRPQLSKGDNPDLVVKESGRNLINEAFRVVRTNFEFMLGSNPHHKLIMTTSINPASGKTFFTMNLAMTLAIKKKKVLVIDLDLRRASLSKYVDSPQQGITNYLIGQTDNIQDVTIKGKMHENLDVIPVGVIPPNPSELLYDGRLKTTLEELRMQYDFVFIDCPPVEIVADAAIINKLTDLTIFVVRAGLLPRATVPQIERFYTEKRYENLCLLLNGTDQSYSSYGYNRYGYNYNTNYGYYHEEN